MLACATSAYVDTHTENGVVAVRFGLNGFDCLCRILNVNTKVILMFILFERKRKSIERNVRRVERASERASETNLCLYEIDSGKLNRINLIIM